VVEVANEGIDTVQSSVTHTLAANVEILFLTGTSAINGTGNALANWLKGNAMNTRWRAAAATNYLDGDAGNDTLSSTSGSTLYNGGAAPTRLRDRRAMNS